MGVGGVCSRFSWQDLAGLLPSAGPPLRWAAQKFALFFRHNFDSFFSLSGFLSLKFGVKRRGPQMCTFGLSGCRVKGPGASNTPKNSTEGPPREREERKKIVAGEGKSAKFWAPHPSGPLRTLLLPPPPHFFRVWGPTLGPHPSPPFRPTPLELHPTLDR